MYTLLAGSPPFWHRKQMLMLRMIMSGNYQFGSPEWDDYSDTVKDLVRGQANWLLGSGPRCQAPLPGEAPPLLTCWRGPALTISVPLPGEAPPLLTCWRGPALTFSVPLSSSQVSRFLVVQPQNRYTAEEALAHPFFQQYVVEEVRHFSPRGKFKVLSVLIQARQLPKCKPLSPLLSQESLHPVNFQSTHPSPPSCPVMASEMAGVSPLARSLRMLANPSGKWGTLGRPRRSHPRLRGKRAQSIPVLEGQGLAGRGLQPSFSAWPCR